MAIPITFYEKELGKHQKEAKRNKGLIFQLGMLRLGIFILAAIGIYFTQDKPEIALIIAVAAIALFLFLIKKHANLKSQKLLSEALAKINEEEIQITSGKFHHRTDGIKFQNPQHHYAVDIDLFGRASFYQYINRTETSEGSQALADELLANNIVEIENRQESIQELAKNPEWRQRFLATARLIEVETNTEEIAAWLKNYRAFIPKGIKWLPLVFSILSLGVIVLYSMSYIPEWGIILWLALGLGITAKFKKKTDILGQKIDRAKDTIRQHASLLEQIEGIEFSTECLKLKQSKIELEGLKASAIFKDLSKRIDAFDHRKNIISAVVSNGFMLYDIKQTLKIEDWIEVYSSKVDEWFKVIAFFDAYNSLGNYAFNHPQYIYPTIEKEKKGIRTKNLGHPLLNPNKRIDNDLKIDAQEFFIITGANMAGKSTFLRTVSLHIVMANIGLPICAEECNYHPIKLITSMRTIDSLSDDSSYFFAELSRLKFIREEIKKDSYFIILDEILKGTNSTDKAIGSRKFVEKLVAFKATGIIATHDLSLCEIAKELVEVKNFYFDAEIESNELHFDYTLKDGICKNMNASFLLKKMEII